MPTRTKLPKGHTLGSLAKKNSIGASNRKFVPGSVYIWTTKDNAVTDDKSQYVAVKIGLAVGDESAAWEVMQGSRTKIAGDQVIVDMMVVNNCGWTERYMHEKLQAYGFSTLHGHDFKLPERYKRYYEDQSGGNEWFVLTRRQLDKFMAECQEISYAKHGTPKQKTKGYIGQTAHNAPVIFKLNTIGQPKADMTGRTGGPIKEQKLKFIWDYRTLSGYAPVGCITTDPQWIATR